MLGLVIVIVIAIVIVIERTLESVGTLSPRRSTSLSKNLFILPQGKVQVRPEEHVRLLVNSTIWQTATEMTNYEYDNFMRIDSIVSDDFTAMMVNNISVDEVDHLLYLMVNNLTIAEAKGLFPIEMVEGRVGTELANLFSNNVMSGVRTCDLSPFERRNIITTRLFLKAKRSSRNRIITETETKTHSSCI